MRKSKLKLTTTATTRERGKLRAIVIEYNPAAGDTLILRASGLRTRYPVAIEDVFGLAARKEADRQRQEKRQARKARKG